MGQVIRLDAIRLRGYGWAMNPIFMCQSCGGAVGDTLYMSGPKKSYAGPFINPKKRTCERWELICPKCRQMYRVAKSIGRNRRKNARLIEQILRAIAVQSSSGGG
jgi:uncharacterized protein YbaR (Trm112 family)